MKPERHSHCAWCGTRFVASPWPRHCRGCGKTTWLNPAPVAVLIVPVDDGVLTIRRGIGPGEGKLALPGGFLEVRETWQAGAAREVWEETGIRLDAAQVREYRVRSTPDGLLLVFGVAQTLREAELPPFAPTNETTERVIVRKPEPLAFDLHEEVLGDWFAKKP